MVTIDARSQRLDQHSRSPERREMLHPLQAVVVNQWKRGPLVSYELVLGTHAIRYGVRSDQSYVRTIFHFRTDSANRRHEERVDTIIPEGEKFAGAVSIAPF